MTLLLMLACLRRLPQLDRFVRNGEWQAAWELQESLNELGGTSVGLLGYGAVPRILHPMLEAMGANVLYWSRSRRNCELVDLLARSDIVSLHLPLTPETTAMLDPWRMKRGSILINTARGALVAENSLYECLQSGHLAAAGLDVFAEEPLPCDDPLLGLSNVVKTPHLAWLTRQTLERSIEAALRNVGQLSAGLALENRVA